MARITRITRFFLCIKFYFYLFRNNREIRVIRVIRA